jgi:hypothetical protein
MRLLLGWTLPPPRILQRDASSSSAFRYNDSAFSSFGGCGAAGGADDGGECRAIMVTASSSVVVVLAICCDGTAARVVGDVRPSWPSRLPSLLLQSCGGVRCDDHDATPPPSGKASSSFPSPTTVTSILLCGLVDVVMIVNGLCSRTTRAFGPCPRSNQGFAPCDGWLGFALPPPCPSRRDCDHDDTPHSFLCGGGRRVRIEKVVLIPFWYCRMSIHRQESVVNVVNAATTNNTSSLGKDQRPMMMIARISFERSDGLVAGSLHRKRRNHHAPILSDLRFRRFGGAARAQGVPQDCAIVYVLKRGDIADGDKEQLTLQLLDGFLLVVVNAKICISNNGWMKACETRINPHEQMGRLLVESVTESVTIVCGARKWAAIVVIGHNT